MEDSGVASRAGAATALLFGRTERQLLRERFAIPKPLFSFRLRQPATENGNVYQGHRAWNTAAILSLILTLQGCLSDDKTAYEARGTDPVAFAAAGGTAKGESTVAAKSQRALDNEAKRTSRQSTSNTAPTITGTPATTVVQDTVYRFVPSASDADGDPLSFSITNRPRWATFNTGTGELKGIPTAADLGTYSNIVISVSDGQLTAQLPAFAITVEAYALGSATLSWLPPTENSDGTPLLDLAAYRVYWGDQPGSYTSSIDITNPGITTYVIENLTSGTYYFAATAVNTKGVESGFSGEAYKAIP
jgi:hypothetical protein